MYPEIFLETNFSRGFGEWGGGGGGGGAVMLLYGSKAKLWWGPDNKGHGSSKNLVF